MEEYRDIEYGESTLGPTGCEVIALYNFMLLISKARSLESIIGFMESRFDDSNYFIISGLGMHGKLGATPCDIYAYLITEKIPYKTSYMMWELENQCTEPGAIILMYWNEKWWESGYHTIAVYYNGNKFYGYNQDTYSKDPVPVDDLSDFLGSDGRFIRGFFVPTS